MHLYTHFTCTRNYACIYIFTVTYLSLCANDLFLCSVACWCYCCCCCWCLMLSSHCCFVGSGDESVPMLTINHSDREDSLSTTNPNCQGDTVERPPSPRPLVDLSPTLVDPPPHVTGSSCPGTGSPVRASGSYPIYDYVNTSRASSMHGQLRTCQQLLTAVAWTHSLTWRRQSTWTQSPTLRTNLGGLY